MALIPSFDDSLRALTRRLRGVPRAAVQLALPKLRIADCAVAPDLLRADSIVYSMTLQQVSAFDRALTDRFGCSVHVLESAADLEACEPTVEFYTTEASQVTRRPQLASASAPELLDRLERAMRRFGHRHLDLLRLDIEGGEYGLVAALARSELRPCQLIIQFHHHLPHMRRDQTERALDALNALGYGIFDCQASGLGYSLALA